MHLLHRIKSRGIVVEEVEIIFDLLEEVLLSSILSIGLFADIDSFGLVVVKLQDNADNFSDFISVHLMALVGYLLLQPWMSFQISSYGVLEYCSYSIVALCYEVDNDFILNLWSS